VKIRESARLRLTPYFLILALPLAIGVWAFGNFAAASARQRTDTELRSALTASVSAYRDEVSRAAVEALLLARTPEIQRAVRAHDRSQLARRAQRTPHLVFLAGGRRLAGTIPDGTPIRAARISNGKRFFGTVVVGVPLDDALLARLRAATELGAHQELVALDARQVVAGPQAGKLVSGSLHPLGELRFGSALYRTATIQVVRGSALRLAVVEPSSVAAAAENRARQRVLLAGLAILGGVALAAYALAPAFARTRFAQAQRAQAAQVLSHVGDGVFLVDQTGTISLWNPGAEALTGVPAEAALQRRPEELFRGWRQQAPRATAEDARPVAVTGRYEVNGNEHWLSVSAVASPVGTVYAFRDLTEDYRLEEARADFVATVSHELRTPLASILGAANTLRSRNNALRSTTRRELLEIVFEQSERLAQLVDQILLANQLSSGGAHVERRGFDPATIARDAVGGLRPGLPRGIRLELHAPPSLPRAVGDPERVRQVLVNLVENACKYSPGGGRVDVLLGVSGGQVRFSVRDEGLGIPQAEHVRIFEKFYRLDAAMSRGVGGSGLGLFICRQLVSLMDGRLWVSSEPGIGSTFTFELPVSEMQSAALGAVGT
jgi:PAS domain S-box-containing protein